MPTHAHALGVRHPHAAGTAQQGLEECVTNPGPDEHIKDANPYTSPHANPTRRGGSVRRSSVSRCASWGSMNVTRRRWISY